MVIQSGAVTAMAGSEEMNDVDCPLVGSESPSENTSRIMHGRAGDQLRTTLFLLTFSIRLAFLWSRKTKTQMK